MAKNLRNINPTLDDSLAFQFKVLKIEGLKREYKFHPKRKWRFDFANTDKKIAIECEGGIHSGGRHVRAKGFEGDCEKYNEAVKMGWRILRFTSNMIQSGQAIKDYLGMK